MARFLPSWCKLGKLTECRGTKLVSGYLVVQFYKVGKWAVTLAGLSQLWVQVDGSESRKKRDELFYFIVRVSGCSSFT